MSESHKPPEVLIVGAGPTGLVLALWLAKSGIRPRIVEKSSGPGHASRAMAVHARTLELYRQLGIDADVIARGLKMEGIRVRQPGRVVAWLGFGDLGGGLSPYPFALSFPQDYHERLLLEKLHAVGIEVEWNTELTAFQDTGDRVRATLKANGATTEADFAYLCGSDGAHSTVRHGLGLTFPGGTYEQQFYVVDVLAEGPAVDGNINVCLDRETFHAVFPIRGAGSCRIIGILPADLAGRENLNFEHLRERVEKRVGIRVTQVNWFSAYRIHHRVADRFRVGRVFVAGDAGHVHSPAGGQGMNTGIDDAINLAWKLAAVLGGRASPALLDTYEPERIRFARSLVATTDRAFSLIVGRDLRGTLFRRVLIPFVAPLAFRIERARRAAFRLISQTRIAYPASPLSVGATGGVHGGDRLPWVAEVDNFAPLNSLDWQIHVYGQADSSLRAAAHRAGIPLHTFAWQAAIGRTGLKRDALYLIRPDGYVALADYNQGTASLVQYLSKFAIKTRAVE